MCLYPKQIDNPKFKSNKKNGGLIPTVNDLRTLKINIGCGKCMECMKKKAARKGYKVSIDDKNNIVFTDSEGNKVKSADQKKRSIFS